MATYEQEKETIVAVESDRQLVGSIDDSPSGGQVGPFPGSGQRAEERSPMGFLQQAIQKGMSVEHIEKLVQLRNSFVVEDQRMQLLAALSGFQANVPVIVKKGSAAFKSTKYSYAKLEDIIPIIRPHMNAHGLSFRFEVQSKDGAHMVCCIVSHAGGGSFSTRIPGMDDNTGSKNTIQAMGSTLTYLQRYTLIMALGLVVADIDDDGNGGGQESGSGYGEWKKEEPPQNELECLIQKAFGWVGSGQRTPEAVIGFIERTHKMTEKQKNSIMAVEVKGK